MKEYTIKISDRISIFYEEMAAATDRTTEAAIEMTLYKVVDIIMREYEKKEE